MPRAWLDAAEGNGNGSGVAVRHRLALLHHWSRCPLVLNPCRASPSPQAQSVLRGRRDLRHPRGGLPAQQGRPGSASGGFLFCRSASLAHAQSASPTLTHPLPHLLPQEPLLAIPPRCGLLADEMGLGKTAEFVALVLCNTKANAPRVEADAAAEDEADVEGWGLPGAPAILQNCTGREMLCYCGGTVCGPGVQCTECQQVEHVACANYCPAEEARAAGTFPERCPPFVCATCLVSREEKTPTRATLIIVPDANVTQWCQEIDKLVRCERREGAAAPTMVVPQ